MQLSSISNAKGIQRRGYDAPTTYSCQSSGIAGGGNQTFLKRAREEEAKVINEEGGAMAENKEVPNVRVGREGRKEYSQSGRIRTQREVLIALRTPGVVSGDVF